MIELYKLNIVPFKKYVVCFFTLNRQHYIDRFKKHLLQSLFIPAVL